MPWTRTAVARPAHGRFIEGTTRRGASSAVEWQVARSDPPARPTSLKEADATARTDEHTIIFPHYLGNGSFRSLGNILENPHIGMLFMDFKTGVRMRVNGEATLSDDAGWPNLFPGSLQTVKVTVREAYKQNQPVARTKAGAAAT
jgi:hypothetical protein